MSKSNDGGPAFPNSVQPDFQYAEPGMTLRDWFAGQALSAFTEPMGRGETVQKRADCAYAFADAMLKAREQSHA